MREPRIVPWFFCTQKWGKNGAVNGHFKVLTIHLFPYERGNPLEKRGGIVNGSFIGNRYLCVQFPDNMEVTRDYIHQLLIKVDSLFQENIDPGFAVASPSKYVIKPIADLQADLSYDDIWRTGEHLSAEQLTDVLFSNSIKFNFWDFQLVKVKSSSMCIILFLNYYQEQKELGIHLAFPTIYSSKDSRGPGDKCIFLIVKSVIDELDLFRLLKGGAPSDEFDEESREIANRISKDRTPEQIAVVIADVFNKAFNLCYSPDIYIKPAKMIKVLLSQE